MKKTIKQQVAEAKEILSPMQSYTELRQWAIDNGFDNRSAFPKFKDALKEIGIDYELLKTGKQVADAEQLEIEIKHEVTLYVDAKASAGRYGITDDAGNVLWHGRFFDTDDAGEQSRAELCAASKAVWLASKIKEALGDKAISLILIVDAQWLCYQDHAGQKGYKLTQQARKFNIKLSVEWVSGKNNPADYWTTAQGYKKWQDNDLQKLVVPYRVTDEA